LVSIIVGLKVLLKDAGFEETELGRLDGLGVGQEGSKRTRPLKDPECRSSRTIIGELIFVILKHFMPLQFCLL
jgi:hypothetical protein